MEEILAVTPVRSPGNADSSQTETEHGRATAEKRSDEELMLAYAAGRNEAFVELFARYQQPLFGFFRRRISDATQAEELTQEAFLAVVRGAANYKPTALFRTYLYAIGLRMVRLHRRKRLLRDLLFGIADPKHEPATEQYADATLALQDAVQKLPAPDREILMLREFEELTYSEIAELLHLPINTVRSRLFRARMALKAVLNAPVRSAQSETATGKERR
jgi:RNA polymerase sigma factor (sigma-70 family)